MDLLQFVQTPLGAGLLGLALLVVGYGYFKLTMSERSKGVLKLLGIVLVAYAALTYMNIPITIEQEPPASTISGFTVTGSEAHSYVTVDQASQTFVWNTGYDWSGDAIDGATQATFTFSIARDLGNVGLVQTGAEVVSIPDVYNDTAQTSASLISKTGTQYNAVWTRSTGTGIESITITIAEDADGASVSLNLTLSQAAIRNMDAFDTQVIRLWAIEVLSTG
jgi:hypothetical protein